MLELCCFGISYFISPATSTVHFFMVLNGLKITEGLQQCWLIISIVEAGAIYLMRQKNPSYNFYQ